MCHYDNIWVSKLCEIFCSSYASFTLQILLFLFDVEIILTQTGDF